MIIEKMPETIPLTRTIKTGYRAHERVMEGLRMVDYYGWGETRADAIAECLKKWLCHHDFRPAAGFKHLMRCTRCAHTLAI